MYVPRNPLGHPQLAIVPTIRTPTPFRRETKLVALHMGNSPSRGSNMAPGFSPTPSANDVMYEERPRTPPRGVLCVPEAGS